MATDRRRAAPLGAGVTVSAHYAATPEKTWEELRRVDRHVQWMTDAVSIEFLSDQREGVGTSFRCRARVGPLVTNDLMTITRWEENSVMGVAHRGLVKGSGTFTLNAQAEGTVIVWQEELVFPWWALGPLGAWLARPVLRRLWAKNLRNLGQLIA